MAVSFLLFLSFLIVQRIGELILSARHERWLRAHGAVEVGQAHYPCLVVLHVAFFMALTAEVLVLRRTPADWWWIPFAFFLAAQFLRYWSIATLGHRWTTRILVLPGAPPIMNGPYRYLRHPNYLAVAIELLCIPLIFRAYLTAIIFTLLNLILMSIRIPTEERALR
jgi:methyltransferase